MIDGSFQAGSIILAIVAGFALGIAYFWGLWWTSQRVAKVRMAGLFFMASFVLRMVVLIGGMLWVTRGQLVETALCLISVMIGRRVVTAYVRRGEKGDAVSGH